MVTSRLLNSFPRLGVANGKSMRRVCTLAAMSVVCFVLSFVSSFVSSARAQQYTVNDLGGLQGYMYTSPHSINNSGQVVGGVTTADFSVTHPFRTAPNAPINSATDDLGLMSGATSGSANSINASGQVSGSASFQGTSRAFRLDPGNPTFVDLGLRLAGTSSNANGINASGQVTGAATATPAAGCFGIFSSRAFRTAANGTVPTSDDLGTLDQFFGSLVVHNCRSSVGFAINASGQVAGRSAIGNVLSPNDHAVLASPNAALQDLGTLGGLNSIAWSINDAGQVVGDSQLASNPPFNGSHAFLKNAATSMQDIGTLGGTFSSAQAINNAGQVVGNSTLAGDSAIHAFIYMNGTMTDLNTLIPANSGWLLQGASALNDLGQIVGSGRLNGVPAAFRLDPAGSAGINILLSELANGALPLTSSEVGSLSVKLQAALASLRKENTNPVSGQMGAFINQVNAFVNSGRLTAAQAAPLIAGATNVINNL